MPIRAPDGIAAALVALFAAMAPQAARAEDEARRITGAGDWSVFADESGAPSGRMCWIATLPAIRRGDLKGRDVMMMWTVEDAAGGRGVVSFAATDGGDLPEAGYAFAVGGHEARAFTQGAGAWLPDAAADMAATAALERAALGNLPGMIALTGATGALRYPARGFARARAAAERICDPARPLAELRAAPRRRSRSDPPPGRDASRFDAGS